MHETPDKERAIEDNVVLPVLKDVFLRKAPKGEKERITGSGLREMLPVVEHPRKHKVQSSRGKADLQEKEGVTMVLYHHHSKFIMEGKGGEVSWAGVLVDVGCGEVKGRRECTKAQRRRSQGP